MVAGQQQAQRCGERQAAVRTVGGEPLVTALRGHRGGQVLRIRQGVQAQAVVADAHLPRRHLDVLQTVHVTQRQGEISAYDARFLISSDKLVIGEPAQFDMPRIVQDTRELLHRLDELHRRFLVLYLLRHDMPPTQRVPVALLPHALLRGLRQEQVALVVQERALVEVHLVAAGEEAHAFPAKVGAVPLLHVPVLLVQYRMMAQKQEQKTNKLEWTVEPGFMFGVGEWTSTNAFTITTGVGTWLTPQLYAGAHGGAWIPTTDISTFPLFARLEYKLDGESMEGLSLQTDWGYLFSAGTGLIGIMPTYTFAPADWCNLKVGAGYNVSLDAYGSAHFIGIRIGWQLTSKKP